MRITTEKTITALGDRRYHYVVHGHNVGVLSGTPGRSRSLDTWRSKRAALAAGHRNWDRSEFRSV